MNDATIRLILGISVKLWINALQRTTKNLLGTVSSIKAALCLIVLVFTTAAFHPAYAQSDMIAIVIEWPNEGETLYAGPSSLLYKIPVKGRVQSSVFNYDELEVQLEIFKEAVSIGSWVTTPNPDGYFEIFVTVNPDGSTESFPVGFRDCALMCHSPGNLNLEPGNIKLLATAIDPEGNQASVERNIVVDISDYAQVPVKVVLADDPERIVENVHVSASTWLYMWRSRSSSSITDDSGNAVVRVEALSQAPTEYVFRVEPNVADGVLYESIESIDLTLPPGATSAPLITLEVSAQTGKISGFLRGGEGQLIEPIPVLAIHLPEGTSNETLTTTQGAFEFPEMPIDQFLITVDNSLLNEHGLNGITQKVDLVNVVEASVEIPVIPIKGSSIRGMVLDDMGTPLPFAWVTTEVEGNPQANFPDTGQYALHDFPSESITLLLSAPGFYSQAQVVDLSSGSTSGIDFTLTQQEGTERISWGEGYVLIPANSQIRERDNSFLLERGWIWGDGADAELVIILSNAGEISLSGGKFALEYFPGQSAWLYVFDGKAEVTIPGESETVAVHANHMMNLASNTGFVSVPYDVNVLSALRSEIALDIEAVWEPTLSAQIRDRLALIGISIAQLVTLITNFIAVLSLVVVPLIVLYWWWKNRRSAKTSSSA